MLFHLRETGICCFVWGKLVYGVLFVFLEIKIEKRNEEKQQWENKGLDEFSVRDMTVYFIITCLVNHYTNQTLETIETLV